MRTPTTDLIVLTAVLYNRGPHADVRRGAVYLLESGRVVWAETDLDVEWMHNDYLRLLDLDEVDRMEAWTRGRVSRHYPTVSRTPR